jgi:hypothetical protein
MWHSTVFLLVVFACVTALRLLAGHSLYAAAVMSTSLLLQLGSFYFQGFLIVHLAGPARPAAVATQGMINSGSIS